MNRAPFLALLLLSAAAVASAAEPGLPIGPLPQFGLVQIGDGGRLEISQCVSKPVYETRTKEVPYVVKKEVNGQIVEERRVKTSTYQVRKWVSDMRVKAFEQKNCRIVKDGAELDAAAAAKLLSKPTPVVFLAVSDFQEKLDPFYVQFLKAGTIVIRVQEAPQPPAPDPYN